MYKKILALVEHFCNLLDNYSLSINYLRYVWRKFHATFIFIITLFSSYICTPRIAWLNSVCQLFKFYLWANVDPFYINLFYMLFIICIYDKVYRRFDLTDSTRWWIKSKKGFTCPSLFCTPWTSPYEEPYHKKRQLK